MIREFKNDEGAYRAWVASNPGSYVVNTTRTPSPQYLVLHRAACKSISSDKIPNYTTKDYLKIAGDTEDELQVWAKRVGGPLTRCSLCKT